MMKTIIIHPHVDLDACACAWAVQAEKVHFLPSQLRELPATCPCCGEPLPADATVLDHPIGEKGRLDDDGKRHAALLSISIVGRWSPGRFDQITREMVPGRWESDDAWGIEPRLVAEVDEQDSTGIVQEPRFSLGEILAGLRQEALERGLSGKAQDLDLLETTRRIFQGIQLRHESRMESDEWIAENVTIHEIGHYRFASCALDLPPTVGEVLNKQGVSGSIYGGTEAREAGAKDWNIGVFRFPGREEPDLRVLAGYLPGWFVHTTGFLVAWGSRKAPATTLPPEGTPQSQAELLDLMRRVLG